MRTEEWPMDLAKTATRFPEKVRKSHKGGVRLERTGGRRGHENDVWRRKKNSEQFVKSGRNMDGSSRERASPTTDW